MNKLINGELKQLLYYKGWRYDLKESIHGNRGLIVEHSLAEQRWNQGNISYIDNISIADVVMWLYEKHGIWIEVCHDNIKNEFYVVWKGEEYNFNSPTEAYEAAIEYVLNKII